MTKRGFVVYNPPVDAPTDAFDPIRKKFLVCEKRCDECLFSKAKLTDDPTKLAILDECRNTGKYFLCHKGTLLGKAVVCRGFFDTEPNQACRVADRLDLVELVDPESR